MAFLDNKRSVGLLGVTATLAVLPWREIILSSPFE